MPLISPGRLEQLLVDIYVAKGVPHVEAGVVARHQTASNLAGHDSHGAIRTPIYVRRIENGDIVPGAAFEIERETATTAVINGNWGFGFVQTERATQLALHKAELSGVGAVTIRYQGHMGRLGAYMESVASAGMIGMLAADSGRGPKSVVPFGGRTARLGTNPIAFGFPSTRGPVVLDMATSAVAGGKVEVLRNRGEPLGQGWVIDAAGRATTDPNAYFQGGALLPMGGDQAHKGYGLSVVVEILCGLLTGLGFGVQAEGRHNDGNFLAVFDVARFRDQIEFESDVDEFLDYLKATPLADGVDEIYYPGEIEVLMAATRARDGIPIEDRTWMALTTLAGDLQVTLPDVVVGREAVDLRRSDSVPGSATNGVGVATIPATVLVMQPLPAPAITWLRAQGAEVLFAYEGDDWTGRASSVRALIYYSIKIDKPLLDRLPNLEIIGKRGAGVDSIDLAEARARGIKITNVGAGGNANAVAEHAVTLLLAATRSTPERDAATRHGLFHTRFDLPLVQEISGSRVGIVGAGNIGRRLADLLRGFGCELGYFDPYVDRALVEALGGRLFQTVDQLAEWADNVIVAAPLTAETRDLIGSAQLELLGPQGVVVIISRGGIVNEQALAEALATSTIRAAGVDVYGTEPPPDDHPLFDQPRAVLSPHVAGASEKSRERTSVMVSQQVWALLHGEPAPLVDDQPWLGANR